MLLRITTFLNEYFWHEDTSYNAIFEEAWWCHEGMEAVKYWIMGRVMWRLESSNGSHCHSPGWRRVALSEVRSCGVNICCSAHWNWSEIHHQTDRKYLETANFFCDNQRQLYYYVRLQSNTTESQYLCGGRELGGWCHILDVKTQSWRDLYYSVEVPGPAIHQYL